ncbi:MAG: sensor histidine kinase, partial [Candidatus Nitrosomaritimum yanchengensis]
RKIIDEAILPLETEILQKEVEKAVSLDNEIELACDARRISQVLGHILDNSIKSIEPKSGKIWINVSKAENELHISIIDNGTGIPSDQLDKVFTKFYQVDMSNTREKGGMGLGLSICKKIIEAHKGKIWAESELGKGTTMNIMLPTK